MPDYELRPDNWRTWPAELFDREDPAPDEQFYLEPRKVVHIDLYAIQAVTDLYRELVPPNSVDSRSDERVAIASAHRSEVSARGGVGDERRGAGRQSRVGRVRRAQPQLWRAAAL